jgi:putative membrane protein
MADAFEPRERLHPMSWLFGALTFIRQFIVPLIAAAIFGSRDGMPNWLGFLVLPMLGAAIWKQYFYRYGLGPTGLVIREGLLFRNVRQIDYSRIENIDTERGVLHRLLGVAEVRVETSTGGKPEALIQVLGLPAAEELRREVFASRGSGVESAASAETEETLLQLPTTEVIKFGLIDNRGMIVVAGLFGLLHESGVVEFWSEVVKSRMSVELLDELIARGPFIQFSLGLAVLVVALALVRLFSVVLALVTLHGFRLTRVGADFRARYGLLTRIALTLRVRRIQAAHMTETLLHRLFGRVSVRVDLAGDGVVAENSEDARSKVRWLAPLCEPNDARKLIAMALPDVDFTVAADWQSLAPGARRRVFRKSVIWWVIISVALAVGFQTYSAVLLLALGLPISFWHATMYIRNTRWALQADAVFFKYGWLSRKLIVVPRNRVQTVCLTESPFDRRHRMAAVCVDTAGAGPRSDQVRIPYLAADVAQSLAKALYASAAVEAASEREPKRASFAAATAV